MEELVLNNRTIKLIDGEIYAWKCARVKNPYWRKVKYSKNRRGYYFFTLDFNKIVKHFLVARVLYKFNNPAWDIHDNSSTNIVDHIDNCRTNNNIENLRIVNSSQNSQNRATTKGYTWRPERNKYQATIMINYKSMYIGCYDTAEEAREAYLNAKEKYHSH